jgi:hypothetical protein
MSSGVTWRKWGYIPPWVNKHAMALLEVHGYRNYILEQDLEKVRAETLVYRRRSALDPTWLNKAKDAE